MKVCKVVAPRCCNPGDPGLAGNSSRDDMCLILSVSVLIIMLAGYCCIVRTIIVQNIHGCFVLIFTESCNIMQKYQGVML